MFKMSIVPTLNSHEEMNIYLLRVVVYGRADDPPSLRDQESNTHHDTQPSVQKSTVSINDACVSYLRCVFYLFSVVANKAFSICFEKQEAVKSDSETRTKGHNKILL